MSDEVFDDGFGAEDYDWESGVVNTQGIDEGELNAGGGLTIGGKYHFHVSAVTAPKKPDPSDDNPSTPCWRFDCQVLEADYPEEQKSQAGKIHFQRLYVAKKVTETVDGKEIFVRWDAPAQGSVKSMCRFALGLGLITEADLDNPKTVIPWKNAEGRQFCAEIVIDKSTNIKTGKESVRSEIPFSEIFAVDDERVEDWPKNKQALFAHNQAKGAVSASSPAANDDLGDI